MGGAKVLYEGEPESLGLVQTELLQVQVCCCSQAEALNRVDWNAWMFTPGMPPVKPQ